MFHFFGERHFVEVNGLDIFHVISGIFKTSENPCNSGMLDKNGVRKFVRNKKHRILLFSKDAKVQLQKISN